MPPRSAAASGAEASLRPLAEIRRSALWAGWRQLAAEAPPFLHPEFFALSARMAEGRALAAVATRGAEVIGVLPLLHGGGSLRRLASGQTPGFDYCGSPQGLEAIWSALRKAGGWREILLEGIPDGSPLASHLPALARAGHFPAVLSPAAEQRYLVLQGFEPRLDSRFRTGLRRCERKAGGVELERLLRPSRADFEESLAIEAMAWKAANGTSIAADPGARRFYRAVGRLLGARGRGALCFLRVGGRRIATVLTVEDGSAIYALKTGYDPEQSALSPGHLLFWKVALDAERRGLERLEFLGRDSEWKRKWTDDTHALVTLRIYRRSARGLATHLLRESVKPMLPERMRDFRAPLRHGCQRDDHIGRTGAAERLRYRLGHGLGLRSGLRRLLAAAAPARPSLGEPSRFAPGDWVRVREEAAVRATLDARSRNRGLLFIPQQWPTCGRTYRVLAQVRQMRRDDGRYAPIARTVLLEGTSCAGDGTAPAGCGRHCPSMYRDEWLEPAARPPAAAGPVPRLHARVRELEEILGGLGLSGRRDGLQFMPEMGALAGRRFAVSAQVTAVFECDRWVEPRAAVFILEGVHCSGAIPGEPGPCHRACPMLWHRDWLLLDPPPPQGKT